MRKCAVAKVPGNEAMIAVDLTDFKQVESVQEQKVGRSLETRS